MTVIWSEASTELIHLAEDLVAKYHPDLRHVSIGFIFRSEAQISGTKLILGNASKTPAKLKPYIDFDFIIWIAEDEWTKMSTDRRAAALDHELCHCTLSDGAMRIRHHDVEEFTEIIERYGVWKSDLVGFADAIQRSPQMQLALQIQDLQKIGRIGALKTEQAALIEPAGG